MEKNLTNVLESIRLKACEMKEQAEMSNDEIFETYFSGKNEPVESENVDIVLQVENGEPVVSSREVAERFEKEHRSVLRAIEAIVKETRTAQNCALLEKTNEKERISEMFYRTEYVSAQNKKLPMYLMNRDGFSLLCMGFTGEKALKWKLKYIEAFNKMEGALRERNEKPKSKTLILSEALLLANSVIEEEKQKNAELELKVAKLKPASDYAHAVLLSDESMTTTQIAQNYGMTARKFNSLLKKLEIQRKVNDQWVLYSKYQGKGYVVSIPVDIGNNQTKENTRWTRTGQAFLYKQLKNIGCIPVNEQLNMFAM